MSSASIEQLEMKAKQATTEDGVTEMLLGCMLLFFGVLFYLETPFAALAALLPLAMNPIGRFLRRRYVYPRVGYARVAKTKGARRRLRLAGSTGVAILLCVLGVLAWIKGFEPGYGLWTSHVIPAIVGIFIAIGPAFLARRYHLVRWYALAGILVACSVFLPVLGIAAGYRAIALTAAVTGALALLCGVALLTAFVRRHPAEVVGHVED